MQNDFNDNLTISSTTTTYSDVYEISPGMRLIDVESEVEAISGAAPTVDVTPQFSSDNVNWVDANALPQQTSTGTEKSRVVAAKTYMRFKIVTSGTFTSATLRLFAQAIAGEVSGAMGSVKTLMDAQRLDDSPTSADSDSYDSSEYSHALVHIDVTETGSPTRVTISEEGSYDDSTFRTIVNDFLSSIIFVDTGSKAIIVPTPSRYTRFAAVAEGTGVADYYDVTISVEPFNQ